MEITINGEDYLVMDGSYVNEETFKKYFNRVDEVSSYRTLSL